MSRIISTALFILLLGASATASDSIMLRKIYNEALSNGKTYETLELAVRIHFRAVHIHPFPNGNGRWSRLLGNIFLKQNDHPLVKWPEETIGVEKSIARDAYIAPESLASTS